MKDFELEYDVKAHAFSINHTNILKQDAKEYEDTLHIKPLQISVQIAFDKTVRVANPDAIENDMRDVADEVEAEVHQELRDLDDKIRKFQKEEEAGSKTAAADADKAVKASKKKLEKLANELGMKTRVVVEKLLTNQNGTKVKCRSASRTVLRGLELNEDFFDEDAKSDADPYFGKLAQGLGASGKEIAKLTLEEKSQRRTLGDEIFKVQALVEKDRGDNDKYEIRNFADENSKEARSLEALAQKYVDSIISLSDKLEEIDKNLTNFEKIIDHGENIVDQKVVDKETKAYRKALDTVRGTMAEKLAAGKAALRLFKEKYGTGSYWTTLEAELDRIPAAAKSAGIMQDSGTVLAKLTKK